MWRYEEEMKGEDGHLSEEEAKAPDRPGPGTPEAATAVIGDLPDRGTPFEEGLKRCNNSCESASNKTKHESERELWA